MRRFGLLTPGEIECRQAKQDDYGIDLLLYKTARTDANILDRVVGEENWANDFRTIGDVLYGGIGLRQKDGSWLWKWDAGTESNMEKEKGEASDAFKRAGFKWGIGRELYTSPKIRFRIADVKLSKNGKCYDTFTVTEIDYDEAESISHLVVLDETTGKTFVWDAAKKEVPTNDEPEPKVITTSERKMLFDVAKKAHGDKAADVVKSVCGAHKYEKTNDITKDDFPKILEEIQNFKIPA